LNLLAIDTSSTNFSLCLVHSDVKENIEFNAGMTHSSVALREIQKILKKMNIATKDLDVIAFSAGPGSFTGIRIACGVAYGMAYSYKIPLIGISSLETTASMAESDYILSTIDARMDEVYLQFFKRSDDKNITPLSEPMVAAPDKLPNPPDEITNRFSVIGSGYEKFKDHFNDRYKSYTLNMASFMASIALDRLPDKFSFDGIQPIYVRNKVAQTIDERK
jgi:tRNA threonylcarbamoyladenosine biosynthesis protein TsaB